MSARNIGPVVTWSRRHCSAVWRKPELKEMRSRGK